MSTPTGVTLALARLAEAIDAPPPTEDMRMRVLRATQRGRSRGAPRREERPASRPFDEGEAALSQVSA